MKKKLNLVLRNPVKLHNTNQNAPELPSPFEKKEIEEKITETPEQKAADLSLPPVEEKAKLRKADAKIKPDEKIETVDKPVEDLRKEMSLRIRQVWEYFCARANADNELRNSFTVTRAEVMREAGIGSTNTYRDALKKMQNLGLIRIELRPGVNAGSVFYLTDEGFEQAKLVLSEN